MSRPALIAMSWRVEARSNKHEAWTDLGVEFSNAIHATHLASKEPDGVRVKLNGVVMAEWFQGVRCKESADA